MIHHILRSSSFEECGVIMEVTGHDADAAALELRSLTGGAGECGYPHPSLEQSFDQMAPYEAGGPGDQRFHSGRS
jgi:hypothetical protein